MEWSIGVRDISISLPGSQITKCSRSHRKTRRQGSVLVGMREGYASFSRFGRIGDRVHRVAGLAVGQRDSGSVGTDVLVCLSQRPCVSAVNIVFSEGKDARHG